MANNVRIGLLIDDFVVPVWVAGMVKKITLVPGVKIAVVISNAAYLKPKRNRQSLAGRIYDLYVALDRKIYHSLPDAAEPIDLEPWISQAPQLHITPLDSANGKEISQADIDSISSYQADVLIKLGFEGLGGAIFDVPPLGVWSLDCYKEYAGPFIPAVSCFFNDQGITGSAVHVLNNDPAKQRTIYRSFSMTVKKSVNRNLNQVYWKSLSFIPRLLALLVMHGEDWFFKYVQQYQQENTGEASRPVSSAKILGILVKKIGREVSNRLRGSFYVDNWKLFYHTGAADHVETAVTAFNKIPAPRGAFWADPQVVDFNERPFVFFEAWDHEKNKGYIAAFEFINNGNIPAVQKILEKPYHLSYPFTFQWEGLYYMIPETAANRTIELYRCTNFPGQWEFVMNLMENVHAVDTTLCFYENRWWMFTNMVENKGASSLDELFIFHTNDFLTTGWQPHMLNPVVSDVRRSRPAGGLFRANEKLYRPSQCSDKIYGHSTCVNQVTRLSPDEFEEINIAMLTPEDSDRYCLGIHSYSRLDKLTVIDKFYRERR